MLEKLEMAVDFFEREYKGTERYLKNKNKTIFLLTDSCIKEGAIQRCLGVAQFVQLLGVPYEVITPYYDTYKERIESL